MTQKISNTNFYNTIADLLRTARQNVVRTINHTMVLTYYEIGRQIIEQQEGKERAEYGKQLLKELSEILTSEFGKGYSVTNLKQMKSFYLIYQKSQTVSDQSSLCWCLNEVTPTNQSAYTLVC